KNDSKRLLDDPVLEVEDAQPGENSEAQEREQLVAPLHHRDVSAHAFYCQRKKRLSRFRIVVRVRSYGSGAAHDSRWMGNQSGRGKVTGAKRRRHPPGKDTIS